MEEMFFCPSCMSKAAPVDGKCPVCGHDVNIQNAQYQLPVNCILNGRYVVGKVLGAGGFGITYIGYDLKLDSRVAIKEYYPSGAANRSISLTVIPTTEVKGNPFELGKSRFLKEAKTLSEFVGDGNIVTLRDYFEENGTAYIVMEYLEGQDLSHYARERGRFEFSEALDLLEPVMLALDEVHKKGLIHRDISPSNIMVLNNGKVKVLDFGSARLQNTSGELSLSVMLKPGYAPMEQYSTHGEQGSWTDVYAMSATIYRLITGKTPPTSTDRLMEDTLEPPSKLGVKITPAQEEALLHGLALRPADRTRTMAELAKELRTKRKTPIARPEPPKALAAEPAKKEMPKKRPLIIGGALLAVLVILVLCLTLPKGSGGETAVQPAQTMEQSLSPEELAAARDAISGHSETTISGGAKYTVGMRADGTVIAAGDNTDGQCNVSDWTDIIAVSAGANHTVGLKADGTVVATEYTGKYDNGQCGISDWTDIVAVSVGYSHTLGLRSDGTVVAAGNNADGQCEVGDWTDIVAVSAGGNHSVGLRSDGTVVAVGDNTYGRCSVSSWTDIVDVSAGYEHTVGLKADGTVIAAGLNVDDTRDISDWMDIVAISAGGDHTAGLKADGTVVVAIKSSYYSGRFDVSGWTDIVAISAGDFHLLGLRADGTVVAAGKDNDGQCSVSDWADIKLPESRSPAAADERTRQTSAVVRNETTVSAGENHVVGLKTDGTVVAAGQNEFGQCDVSDWTGIAAVSAGGDHTVGLKKDGSVVAAGRNDYGQCEVSDWKDIAAISAGGNHTVGLKQDGTVVAAGDDYYNQCNVAYWSDIVAISAGKNHTVGLKRDGTVITAGSGSYGKSDVGAWTDIVAISAGWGHTVGVKADGTVVIAGNNNFGELGAAEWTDIAAVSAGNCCIVGLKNDGRLVSAGQNYYSGFDVSGWRDVVSVSIYSSNTIGLKQDGTVLIMCPWGEAVSAAADWTDIRLPEENGSTEPTPAEQEPSPSINVQDPHLTELAAARAELVCHEENTISAKYGFAAAVRTTGTVIAGVFDNFSLTKYGQPDVNQWTDIVTVSAGRGHTVGLKADGTVVAAGNNESGQCNVGSWTDIVAISTGVDHTVGLKADGTVVAAGDNESGQCNVGDWKDIVAVSAGSGYTVGLKADGTVAALGINDYGQCDVSDWTDIVAVSAGMFHTVGLKLDGAVVATGSNSADNCSVSGWTDIVAVSAGRNHTVGLKADGTVVAVGHNGNGQCDVGDWTDIAAISAGIGHTIGLKADGSVVMGGSYYKYGQSDISEWTGIKLPEGR